MRASKTRVLIIARRAGAQGVGLQVGRPRADGATVFAEHPDEAVGEIAGIDRQRSIGGLRTAPAGDRRR